MIEEKFQNHIFEELNTIKDEINNLRECIKVFSEKQDSLDKKLDSLSGQIANLSKFKTEASAILDDILRGYGSIHEMLGEHEISIRTLRRKPV